MSVEFRIDRDEGLVLGTLKGEVDVDAVLAGLEELIADGDYSPGLNGLTDLREMKWESEQGDLRRLVHFLIEHRKKIGRSRSAVVVSNDRSFGMARMFEAFSSQSSINVRVFRDLEKAKRWLLDKSAEEELDGADKL